MKKGKINQATVQQFHDCLCGKRYQYRTDEGVGVFSFEKTLPGAVHNLDIRIFVKETGYSVYGVLPFHLDVNDPVRVQRMCELLTRVNYALVNGCFEMDLSDGEMRYRIYVSTEGGMIPNKEIIQDSLLAVDAALIYFGSPLVQVLFGPPDLPVQELMQKSGHLLEMQMLEQALRSAARTHAPLEETLGRLIRWAQDDTTEDDPDEDGSGGEIPFLPENQAAGE